MLYFSDSGKIYDTLFFLIEYFNDNLLTRKYKPNFPDLTSMEKYYETVKKDIGEIPELLGPFFYVTLEYPSILSEFFFSNLDLSKDDFGCFINKIMCSKDFLRRKLLGFFENYSDISHEICSSTPLTFKNVALLFDGFDFVVELLCDILKKTYLVIDELYIDNSNVVEEAFSRCQSSSNIRLFSECFHISEECFGEATITFSLMNQYISFIENTNCLRMLVGIRCEDSLISNCDALFSTADNFLITCSGEVRVKILRSLVDNRELTASQIAKHLNCPPTTLIRPISILLENKIIYVSKRSGIQIFYRLNVKNLRKIHKSLNDMFSKIFEEETPENDKEK